MKVLLKGFLVQWSGWGLKKKQTTKHKKCWYYDDSKAHLKDKKRMELLKLLTNGRTFNQGDVHLFIFKSQVHVWPHHELRPRDPNSPEPLAQLAYDRHQPSTWHRTGLAMAGCLHRRRFDPHVWRQQKHFQNHYHHLFHHFPTYLSIWRFPGVPLNHPLGEDFLV